MKSSKRTFIYLFIGIISVITVITLMKLDKFPFSRSLGTKPHYSAGASYAAWNVVLYTQVSDVIIIGEVKSVGKPYLLPEYMNVDQQAEIDVHEVLKGDPDMKTLTVSDLVGVIDLPAERKDVPLEKINGILEPHEKILLFVSKNAEGNYVPIAGPSSKFVIDEEHDSAIRNGGFEMSLKELKAQIKEAMKLPIKKQEVPPVEDMR